MTDARKENEMTPPPEEWLTLPQAARELGKHRQTVLGLAAANELVTDKRAGITFVSRASMDAYRAKQQVPEPVAVPA